MNREWVLFHLREASEELTRTISEIEMHPGYRTAEFRVAMEHLYHHLNTGWNARDAAAERVSDCSQEDFDAWRKFPGDLF